MKKIKPLLSFILFISAVIIASPFAIKALATQTGWFDNNTDNTDEATSALPSPVTTGIGELTEGNDSETVPSDTTPEETTSGEIIPGDTSTEPVTPPDTTAETTAPEAPNRFVEVGEDYFSDALFIGDSRTVGLRDYSAGCLKNACFFSTEGLIASGARKNAYKVLSGINSSGKQTDFGQKTLSALMSEMKFKKIYVMLGINEMGDTTRGIVANISYLIDDIRRYAPDAVIFVCANLHVTKAYSDARVNKYIYNEKIDEVNEKIAELADNDTVFYLNVNELFDDENHALAEGLGSDGVHIWGKYYRQWAEWLYTKGIIKE